MNRKSKYFYVEKHGVQVQVVSSTEGLVPGVRAIGANFTLESGHVGVQMSPAAARSLGAALILAADHYEAESDDEQEVA